MTTKSFQFLTNTQLEKKGDVSQLDTDSDRCQTATRARHD